MLLDDRHEGFLFRESRRFAARQFSKADGSQTRQSHDGAQGSQRNARSQKRRSQRKTAGVGRGTTIIRNLILYIVYIVYVMCIVYIVYSVYSSRGRTAGVDGVAVNG